MACKPDPTKEEFTLYVTDIPYELNEEGLLEIFRYYGAVKGHFYRPRWAYITYGSYAEAESAIRDLNNKIPLNLKVSFGKQMNGGDVGYNKVPTREEHETPNTKNVLTPNKSTTTSAVERTGPSDILDKSESRSSVLKQVAENGRLSNGLCANADPYESSNALWTRGQLTVTPDGKRHVSMGRGFTTYDIPTSHPEVEQQISKVYERRTFGLYEYGKEELENRIGKCQVCTKLTKFFCERCHTFYCNKNCQVTDWPKHQTECLSIPALVTNAQFAPVEVESTKQEQSSGRKVSNSHATPRQPKKLIDALKRENESGSAEANGSKDTEAKSDMAVVFNNLRAKIAKETQASKIQDETEEKMKNRPLEPAAAAAAAVTNGHSPSENREKKWEKMEHDISFSKGIFLPDNKFTDVRVVVTENRELWVQKLDDDDDLKKLMIDLQEKAKESRSVKPMIGRIYAVEYECIWHRAVVKSFDPTTVHFVDYGNDDVVESDGEFREIHELRYVRKFAAKIRLTKRAHEMLTDLKYDDVISVRATSVDPDKTINVEVKGEKDMLTSDEKTDVVTRAPVLVSPRMDRVAVADTKSSSETPAANAVVGTSSTSDKLKSVVNTVAVGEIGVLEIHSKVDRGTYSVTFLPNDAVKDYTLLLGDLPRKCAEAAQNSSHKPTVGSLVCGFRSGGNENDWLRGHALSSSEMAVIDEARVVSVDKTVACPSEYFNICAFGALCKLTDAEHAEFEENDQYEFKVTARAGRDEIEIEISCKQNVIKATVNPWTPTLSAGNPAEGRKDLQRSTLEYAKLKSGDKVVISTYRSPVHYFVRSLDSDEVEYFCRVTRSVGICAQKSSSLRESPTVGQMVLAQFVDDNYYRAIVTKIEDEKITISYVDFGNTEVTDIKKLKILSDDLKQLRSCSSKVILKDVPTDVPLTKEADEYLSVLAANDVPLICKFDGVPFKDGVYLEQSDGVTVNKKMIELLTPPSKKIPDDKVCYMSSDLSVVSLGNIGDTVQVLTLYTIDECYQYAMCPFDRDLMVHVYEVMPKMMAEYCEATEHYIPRDNELCLAAYLNGWYRAVCAVRNYTATSSSVFFIDFGNTEVVSHENIRLMPKDFIAPNAMANICNVVNAAPTVNGRYPPEVEERIRNRIVPDSTVKIKIVRFDSVSGQFDVELPPSV